MKDLLNPNLTIFLVREMPKCILGSVQYRVLKVIYDEIIVNNGDLWYREIERRICGKNCNSTYSTSIRTVLKRLVEMGVLRQIHEGRVVLYVRGSVDVKDFSELLMMYINHVEKNL